MADELAIKAWYALRTKAIHERVTVHDILRRNGVSFRHTGDREEQISCPFHGKDENPSARVYPSSPRSPSHVWCFVCRERWDAISLWKKYSDGDGKSFHQLVSELEKLYNILTPPVPEGAFDRPGAVPDAERHKTAFELLYAQVEHRLTEERSAYVKMGDMNGYLVAGSVLDKIYAQTSEGQVDFREGHEVLKRLLQKMGERIRSGTASQNPHS